MTAPDYDPSVTRTYPPGVPCWVDLVPPDLDVAREFYGAVLGWEFTDAMPPDAPGNYLIASVDGKDVAALGSGGDPGPWATYVAVADCDGSAQAVTAAGGTVTDAPADAGPGGRAATCTDPGGAVFRLWQARRRLGAQLTNAPGTWNFSNLRTADTSVAVNFYATVFGWRFEQMPGSATFVQVPGYGQHLADTVDPGIFERQKNAPAGFADVVAGMFPAEADEPSHWNVIFSVADREDAATTVERLGGAVHDRYETEWSLVADVSDPGGARFRLSQYRPPDGY